MKTLPVILLAAAACAILAWLIIPKAPTGNARNRVLEGFQPENVAKITIANPEGSVTLQLEDGEWVVAERGYPADGARAYNLIQRAWDLRPVQAIAAEPAQFAKFQLVEPGPDSEPGTAATRLAFWDSEGKPLGALLLGKRQTRATQDGMPGVTVGLYVLEAGSDGPVALVSDTFEDAAPAPQTWLDKTFPEIGEIQQITLEGPDEARQWTLIRKDEEWKFSDDGPAPDPEKILSALFAWSDPQFHDVLAADSPDATAFAPVETLKISSADGLEIAASLGKPLGAYTPVRFQFQAPDEKSPSEGTAPPEAPEPRFQETIFLLPTSNVESLARTRASLEPDPPPKPQEPAP